MRAALDDKEETTIGAHLPLAFHSHHWFPSPFDKRRRNADSPSTNIDYKTGGTAVATEAAAAVAATAVSSFPFFPFANRSGSTRARDTIRP
jgi:hypothetical protein